MLTTANKLEAAHAATPTCNAAATSPLTCHSLACRTKAFGTKPTPQQVRGAALRDALIDALEKSAAKGATAAQLGALQGGIVAVLIHFCEANADEVVEIAKGLRS